MSLYAMLKPAGPSGFGYGSTADDVTEGLDLTGKHILLTGCNSGIGLQTLRVLAARGATVLAAARTVDKARNAMAEVGATKALPVACELSEPADVKAAVAAVRELGHELDAIVCNAGIMALPQLTTKHGYELQFLTNHIGHAILVEGLLDQLADDGRVVMVSSDAHQNTVKGGVDLDNLDGSRGYSAWRFYGQSKLCNLLYARKLAQRLGPNQVANAIHPGVIHTNLARSMNPVVGVALAIASPLALKNEPQGAATQTWAAVHPDAGKVNGEYLKDCNVGRSSKHGQDMDLADRLQERTERIIGELT